MHHSIFNTLRSFLWHYFFIVQINFLLCCVYLPNESQPSSFTDFLSVLGELHGLITSDAWHSVFLVRDFNKLQPKCKLLFCKKLSLLLIYIISQFHHFIYQ